MISHDLPVDSAFIQEGDFSLESGYHQMISLLSLEQRPTSCICF